MKRQYDLGKYMLLFLMLISVWSCGHAQEEIKENISITEIPEANIQLGNTRMDVYLPLLTGMRVGVVGNHTSVINGKAHLVDSLLSLGVEVVKVFSPEHGFRGDADAGEKVESGIDPKTSLPIISLYGKNKKPSQNQLEGIDLLLFDIQDVGVRFYTYISTLHYVMEAAAEQGKKVIVLDRPNPNGHYIDGPVLKAEKKSFVGLHPVPVVHGLTIGEYAQMINGEGWLQNNLKADLLVIECKGYTHKRAYALDIAPSPNLPNMKAIYLYPSLCFFEGTPISVGRGTNKPFQQIGHPELTSYTHTFIPKPNYGAKSPKLNNKKCYGIDVSTSSEDELRNANKLVISYLIDFYNQYPDKEKFFTNFFNLLAGNNQLKQSLIDGKSESEIRKSWENDINQFKALRNKYLLYSD